jgi:hypothetical protein
MVRRFGRIRAEVILDHWHVTTIACDLTRGWERGKGRRILSDLNEEGFQLAPFARQCLNHSILNARTVRTLQII